MISESDTREAAILNAADAAQAGTAQLVLTRRSDQGDQWARTDAMQKSTAVRQGWEPVLRVGPASI